jgi:hypothetical protein
LRETRQLVAVEPDFSEIGTPANMMDPDLVIQALKIGKRQAVTDTAAIQVAWDF